jgi:hypothetical protein
MAKKTNAAAPALSAERKALAQKAGIDVSKIDFAKVAQLIQLLLAIFGQVSTPAQLTAAGVKAQEGCEDHCCCCLEAAGLALESAQTSLDCCQGMCETPAP